MGTSLATTLSGEDNQTVFLFYQAEDNVSLVCIDVVASDLKYSAENMFVRSLGIRRLC